MSKIRLSLLVSILVTFLGLGFLSSCATKDFASQPGVHSPASDSAGHTPTEFSTELTFNVPAVNSTEMIDHPTVVLVSIDGYRADYNSLFSPPNLRDLATTGVSAKSLRPAYPSKTFPNHFTLVTGMTPVHHGIVSNEFYDQNTRQSFAVSDKNAVRDGRWYLANPLWILAEQAGMRTASYFWVGSEANIAGAYPNYYFNYSEQVTDAARVDHALAWLGLPVEKRPHLVLIYFSDVDSAAHSFGATSPQVQAAVLKVDEQIGRLRAGIKEFSNVNLVVVSDHGMHDLDPAKVAIIDDSPEVAALLPKFKTTGRGPQMQLYLNVGEDKSVIKKMKGALDHYAKESHKDFRVLMTKSDFASVNYGPSSRTGDLVIDPDMPWAVGSRAALPTTKGANHGWNPKSTLMHGIFYAEGPSFQPHMRLPTVDSIHVTPLLLQVLGLPIPENLDGRLSVMKQTIAR